MKTIAQLARIKKIRAKKRKLLQKYERSPADIAGHPYLDIGDLYSDTQVMTRANYGTIFKRKAHRSPYYKSVKKSFGPKKKG